MREGIFFYSYVPFLSFSYSFFGHMDIIPAIFNQKKNPTYWGGLSLVFTCSIQLSLLFHLFQCYLQLYGSWSNFFLILLSFYTICPDPGDGLLSCNATKVFQFDLLLSGFCQLPQ